MKASAFAYRSAARSSHEAVLGSLHQASSNCQLDMIGHGPLTSTHWGGGARCWHNTSAAGSRLTRPICTQGSQPEVSRQALLATLFPAACTARGVAGVASKLFFVAAELPPQQKSRLEGSGTSTRNLPFVQIPNIACHVSGCTGDVLMRRQTNYHFEPATVSLNPFARVRIPAPSVPGLLFQGLSSISVQLPPALQ